MYVYICTSLDGRADKALSTIHKVVCSSLRLTVTVTGVTPLSEVIINCVSLQGLCTQSFAACIGFE
jgi:hypothetical protein